MSHFVMWSDALFFMPKNSVQQIDYPLFSQYKIIAPCTKYTHSYVMLSKNTSREIVIWYMYRRKDIERKRKIVTT